MASQIIWIILCAGRSAQAARTIEKRVWKAIVAGKPVVEAFGYRTKAEAIERAWRERERDYAALCEVGNVDPKALVAWCGSLPFVGATTQFQLAKNFGVDVCKPAAMPSRRHRGQTAPRGEVSLPGVHGPLPPAGPSDRRPNRRSGQLALARL